MNETVVNISENDSKEEIKFDEDIFPNIGEYTNNILDEIINDMKLTETPEISEFKSIDDLCLEEFNHLDKLRREFNIMISGNPSDEVINSHIKGWKKEQKIVLRQFINESVRAYVSELCDDKISIIFYYQEEQINELLSTYFFIDRKSLVNKVNNIQFLMSLLGFDYKEKVIKIFKDKRKESIDSSKHNISILCKLRGITSKETIKQLIRNTYGGEKFTSYNCIRNTHNNMNNIVSYDNLTYKIFGKSTSNSNRNINIPSDLNDRIHNRTVFWLRIMWLVIHSSLLFAYKDEGIKLLIIYIFSSIHLIVGSYITSLHNNNSLVYPWNRMKGTLDTVQDDCTKVLICIGIFFGLYLDN